MAYDRYAPLRTRRVQRRGREVAKALGNPLKREPSNTDGKVRPPGPENHYRERLYRAEHRIYARMRNQYILRSLEEAQLYCKGVMQGATDYSRHTWTLEVKLALDGGPPRYHAGFLQVAIPVQQMVLLHEMAHHLAGIEAQHSEAFMRPYIYLLDKEIPGISEKLLAELSTDH